MPYALALLSSNPLISGDFYPGDLLIVVMRLPPGYWAAHPGQAVALREIAKAVEDTEPGIQRAIEGFLSATAPHTRGLPVVRAI